MPEIPPEILVQLLQQFEQQKLERLAPQAQRVPAPLEPIASQGVSESDILARLLANPVGLPGGAAEGIDQLGGAVRQFGQANALHNKENQRRLEASSIFKNNQPVDIDALKRAQGLNLSI